MQAALPYLALLALTLLLWGVIEWRILVVKREADRMLAALREFEREEVEPVGFDRPDPFAFRKDGDG